MACEAQRPGTDSINRGKLDNRDLIACMQNGAMERIVNSGRPVHKGMADEDGCLRTERSNSNRVKEKVA